MCRSIFGSFSGPFEVHFGSIIFWVDFWVNSTGPLFGCTFGGNFGSNLGKLFEVHFGCISIHFIPEFSSSF